MTPSITEAVRDRYGAVATSTLTNEVEGVRAIAEAFGYSETDLASIPAEANMGLSCGNPVATANLREGETVVDLGSGGGLDVFLAAKKVGPTGRAIGIDMTPAMIDRARKAAGGDFPNAEFHLASIDALPLPDNSVDVILSNCVINLAPDKNKVFREIARVLKPGGRVAVSDIALKRILPSEVEQSLAAYVGCIAGAILIDEYKKGLEAAGLQHVQVIDTGADLNAYAKLENQSACCSPAMADASPAAAATANATAASCCAPAPRSVSLTVGSKAACCSSTGDTTPPTSGVHKDLGDLLQRFDANHYAASVKVYAIK